MTFQDEEELTEEEKSEWAMDIAYDMDEFFRQPRPAVRPPSTRRSTRRKKKSTRT